MADRIHLSRTKRLKIFEARGGICIRCDLRIQADQKWEIDHERALCLGGSNDMDNLFPMHSACHKTKTAEDIGRKSKADRQRMKHLGIRKKGRPIPYRLFDGTPVWPARD